MADWYVDAQHGDDGSGTGSSTAPYASIQAALDDGAFVGGDTVKISGYIQENVNANNATTIFEGAGRNQTIWDGNNIASSEVIVGMSAANITIKNMTCQNVSLGGVGKWADNSNGANSASFSSDNVIFKNVRQVINNKTTNGIVSLVNSVFDGFVLVMAFGRNSDANYDDKNNLVSGCTFVNPDTSSSEAISTLR